MFVEWLQGAGVLSQTLGKKARWGWTEAARLETLGRVRDLREVLRETVAAIIDRRPMPPAILALVNPLLYHRPGRELVLRANGALASLCRPRVEQPADLLYPIAESAADLLAGTRRDLIRRCEHPDCPMVFVDLTLNHIRRCCMATPCGRAMRYAVGKATGQKRAASKPPRVNDQGHGGFSND